MTLFWAPFADLYDAVAGRPRDRRAAGAGGAASRRPGVRRAPGGRERVVWPRPTTV